MITNILLSACILIFIHFGFVNVGKLIRGHKVSTANIFVMAASATGIITHFIGMW
jgi:hypothetical protein